MRAATPKRFFSEPRSPDTALLARCSPRAGARGGRDILGGRAPREARPAHRETRSVSVSIAA